MQKDKIDAFLLQKTLLSEGTNISLPGFKAFHLPSVQDFCHELTILARHTLHCTPISQPLSCGDQVEDLFSLAATEPVLVGGDYNAHHPILASTGPTNEAGFHLSSALRDSHHITLLNDVAQPTHIGNGRLDLALIFTRLVHFHHPTLTRDHFGVIIDIWTILAPPPPCPQNSTCGMLTGVCFMRRFSRAHSFP